jgi:Flp pilus assembly protein TadD
MTASATSQGLRLLGTLLVAAAPAVAEAQRGGAQAQQPLRLPGIDINRPIFLSGRVVLEDGTPPPEPVMVAQACGGGRPIPQGYTDSNGRFSFEVGRHAASMMDVQNPFAAAPSGLGGSSQGDLTGCELRAMATGFTSDAIDLGGRRLLESPDVGTIVLRRLEGVVGSTFSATTLLARKEVREAYEKGRELAGKKEYDEAIEAYREAVRSQPRFAAAWFELGLVHQIQNHAREAEEAYQRAVAADPEYVKPYRQLAFIAFHEQRWPDVLEATDRLLYLDPVSYPDGYYFDSVARFQTGDLEAAERSARKATTVEPERTPPRAHAVLGAILIEKQDYVGAAEELRAYLALVEPGPEADQARAMLEHLEARLPPPGGDDPE